MSLFSRFFVAAGLLQTAFASPTLRHVPAHEAARLQARQTSNTSDTNLLNDLVRIIIKADPVAGSTVSGLVSDLLGGIGGDLDEATQIFSAIET